MQEVEYRRGILLALFDRIWNCLTLNHYVCKLHIEGWIQKVFNCWQYFLELSSFQYIESLLQANVTTMVKCKKLELLLKFITLKTISMHPLSSTNIYKLPCFQYIQSLLYANCFMVVCIIALADSFLYNI